MKDNKTLRLVIIITASILGLIAFLYLCGLGAQLMTNYADWLSHDGFGGNYTIHYPSMSPIECISEAFTANGLRCMGFILLIGAVFFLFVKLHDRFGSKDRDPRGFTKSKSGLYGTADFMTDKEMKDTLR